MSDNGELREDLKLPDGELGLQLKSEYDGGKELLVCIISCVKCEVYRGGRIIRSNG